MRISVSVGTGSGPTTLAAFDGALMDAGVTHWNLLHLSSVVPTGAEIVLEKVVTPPDEFGQRRYVVMAHKYATQPGEEAWAGLGWCQKPENGEGLFVEITGSSEAEVERDITLTLNAMKARRSFQLGPNRSRVAGITCTGEAVCALVVALFPGTGPWPGT